MAEDGTEASLVAAQVVGCIAEGMASLLDRGEDEDGPPFEGIIEEMTSFLNTSLDANPSAKGQKVLVDIRNSTVNCMRSTKNAFNIVATLVDTVHTAKKTIRVLAVKVQASQQKKAAEIADRQLACMTEEKVAERCCRLVKECTQSAKDSALMKLGLAQQSWEFLQQEMEAAIKTLEVEVNFNKELIEELHRRRALVKRRIAYTCGGIAFMVLLAGATPVLPIIAGGGLAVTLTVAVLPAAITLVNLVAVRAVSKAQQELKQKEDELQKAGSAVKEIKNTQGFLVKFQPLVMDTYGKLEGFNDAATAELGRERGKAEQYMSLPATRSSQPSLASDDAPPVAREESVATVTQLAENPVDFLENLRAMGAAKAGNPPREGFLLEGFISDSKKQMDAAKKLLEDAEGFQHYLKLQIKRMMKLFLEHDATDDSQQPKSAAEIQAAEYLASVLSSLAN